MSLCHNEGILLLLGASCRVCLFASLTIPWFEYLTSVLLLEVPWLCSMVDPGTEQLSHSEVEPATDHLSHSEVGPGTDHLSHYEVELGTDSLCLCTLPRQIWRRWDVRFCPPPSSPQPSRTTSLPLVVKWLLSALAEAREEAAGASTASRALLAALVLVLGLGLVTLRLVLVLGLVLEQLGLLLVLGLVLVQILVIVLGLVLVQGLVHVPRLEPSSVRPR